MVSPLPGVSDAKPGAALPLPGIEADVVDERGDAVPNGCGGYLVLTEPWPSMLRTIWGDDDRYVETYWSRYPGRYFPGDGAKKDEDGDLWLLGRVDDVMLVSGHNISTTEVESALVSHPSIAEAAVVGATDPVTGQGIVAFVIIWAARSTPRVSVPPGAPQPRRPSDRRHRQATSDHGRQRAAQDPVGQDHASPAQGRRRTPRAGRRDHAGGPDVMGLIAGGPRVVRGGLGLKPAPTRDDLEASWPRSRPRRLGADRLARGAPGSLVGRTYVDAPRSRVPSREPESASAPAGRSRRSSCSRRLRQETVGGLILVAATVVALLWANSPWSRVRACADFAFGPHALGMHLTVQEWTATGSSRSSSSSPGSS